MKRAFTIILAVCLLISAAPSVFAATEKTLTLTEDWRLTDDLDLAVADGTELIIVGNGYYIYEMGGALKNTGSGTVYLQTLVYAQGDNPTAGTLAALSKAARTLTVTAPAKDATTLAMSSGVTIKSSSNTNVIKLDGTVIPPSSATTVTLVMTLTDASGNKADTGTISVTVPAKSGGGGGGGGAPAAQTIPANDGEVQVGYTQTGDGVKLDLPDTKVDEIIDNTTGGTASLDLTGVTGATAAAIPAAALKQLSEAGLGVEIILPQGTITLDADAAASAAKAGGDITISIGEVPHSSLTPAQQAAISATGGTVFDITMKSGNTVITNFNGTITVTVPYTGPLPAAVWYLNDKGELEELKCTYDAKTGTVTFTTDHLSLYVIGKDTAWVSPFTDVKASDWFYGDVEYVYLHGLMVGTSETLFSPGLPVTRGMIVTILYRQEGSPDVSGLTNPFSDVAAGKFYFDAVLWASDNGIVLGSDGKFSPENNVTRQDLATILWRYAKFAGYDVSADADISAFGDASSVAGYASDAVRWACGVGIITGKPGNLIDPRGTATRAEAAAMLHRFLAE